jgi:hypothetical protein
MLNSYQRAEKLRELQWELRDEDAQIGAYNPFNSDYTSVKVFIDGKYWKTMSQGMARKSAATLRAKGKTVTWRFYD